MLDIRKELIEQIELPLRFIENTEVNQEEYVRPSGKEHYKLLAYLTTIFHNVDIIDIGTHRGASAAALSLNPINRVHSFDIEHKYRLPNLHNVSYYMDNLFVKEEAEKYEKLVLGSAFIFLDIDPHDGILEYQFFEWLKEKQYQGLLICDDIWYFKGMRDNFWYKIPTEYKKDITELGHWSGTGIIQFTPKYFEPVKLETNYTLVTAYFDLTRMSDSSQEIRDRPKSHYFENAKATMSLDHNLVVFCEEDNLEEIRKLRPSFLQDKTRYITMNFEDFPMNKFRDQITENRKYIKSPDNRNTVSYYLFCMSRYAMLKTIMKENPFQSTHFAWINFCIERMGFRNLIELDNVFNLLRDKVSTCFIDYQPYSLVKNPKEYFKDGGLASLCSGFFTGKQEYLYEFCEKVEAQFLIYLNQGYGHADEQLFCPVFLENRHIFDVYYGDYQQMITNYIWTKESPSFPLTFVIPKSYACRDYDVCLHACKMLWNSYKQGEAEIHHSMLNYLVNIYRNCLIKKGLPPVLE